MADREAVEKLLDEKVRPGLSLHGGDIAIEELTAGVLKVRLLGNCSGCLSADSTMKELVESSVLGAFPDIKEVSLVTGVSDSLISEAKEMLRRRHS